MLANHSYSLQILIALAMMLIFLYLQIKQKPYGIETLNSLELMSVGVTVLTLDIALLYNTEISHNQVALFI